ncbi:uncharacterized protein VTP21DRAFT_9281 [Calcarisporiella thermophila]|uniref:uncharacterized protein n=1 Tax=Calcarisporiella thermophila TaxID=911321 RepID=UPI0037445472
MGELSIHHFQRVDPALSLSYRPSEREDDASATQALNGTISPSQPFQNTDLVLTYEVTSLNPSTLLLSLQAQVTTRPLRINALQADFPASLEGRRMLVNGFQSWSQTRELGAEDKLKDIAKPAMWLGKMELQGDYGIFDYSNKAGELHSNEFTLFRLENSAHHDSDPVVFLGSVSHSAGYTYFKAFFKHHRLSIVKDIDIVLKPGEKRELLRVLVAEGSDVAVFQEYAKHFEDKRVSSEHVTGWTSWYNWYEDVTEQVVLSNLEAMKKHGYPIDIFQIDDGFENAVGDWLELNPKKFPNGFTPIVSKIKAANFKPGLWLAPFAAAKHSNLVKQHPDWVLTDSQGDMVLAGSNWGGFYALDFYNDNVRDYLRRVFDTVLNEWGFDMVKLDFLFAAAMIPAHGKSRGEIMYESMQFLRELVGKDRLLLGCGVPLASGFGLMDYCRIGSDVATFWDSTVHRGMNVRERVSTLNSLYSTLHRWQLNHLFGNDPDVVMLRTTNCSLSPEEKHTLLVCNNVLGSLVFISDNVDEYTAAQHRAYSATFPKVRPSIERVVPVRRDEDVYALHYTVAGRHYTTYVNLGKHSPQIPLPFSPKNGPAVLGYFRARAFDDESEESEAARIGLGGCLDVLRKRLHVPGENIRLRPHQTRTFMRIDQPLSSPVVGSLTHIVPGTELAAVENVTTDPSAALQLAVKWEKLRHGHGHVFLRVAGEKPSSPTAQGPKVVVNGKESVARWIAIEGQGMWCVEVVD